MNTTLIQYHGQTTTSKALPLCPPYPDWTFPATYISWNRYSQLPFCGSSPVEKTNASQWSGQYTHVSECFGAFIFSSLDETGQDLWWLPFYMGWKGENFAKLPNLHGIISLFDTWLRISPFIYNLRQTMKWPRKGYMRIPHHGVRRISSWVYVLPQIWATYLHIIFWSKNGPKETMHIPIYDEVWSNHPSLPPLISEENQAFDQDRIPIPKQVERWPKDGQGNVNKRDGID